MRGEAEASRRAELYGLQFGPKYQSVSGKRDERVYNQVAIGLRHERSHT